MKFDFLSRLSFDIAALGYQTSNIILCNHVYVDVVKCLKGSDDNDVHNHLVISDLVSILRFEKSG